ncbi:GDP-mannose 4,6-dehydratase, partial [Clostridium sp. D43t1_170807_H7]
MKTYLVTGGAGFIGSNFVLYMLKKYEDIRIINLDKLTYAGNLENLKSIQDDPRHIFVHGD